MSDDPNRPKGIVQTLVAAAESMKPIHAFFEKVGGNNPCEACGCSEWFFYPGNPRFSLVEESNSDLPKQEFLVICCNNCGNTRMFNWSRISYFIDKQYKEEGDA